jgi:hypothetical protein
LFCVVIVGTTVLPAAAPAADADGARMEAKEAYDAVVAAFLDSNWAKLREAQKKVGRTTTRMTPQQRANLLYIRKAVVEYRPAWWRACKSTVRTQIRARVWGRNLIASYTPADQPAMSATLDGPRRIKLSVSWNPSLVDSRDPEKGPVGEQHNLTKGDLGEVLVWRQLGYSYVTVAVPSSTLLSLYNRNRHLYQHLQAFIAYVTCMYHCSPKARRAAMLSHAVLLQNPNTPEAHVRAARAVSALFTATVLADPSKWPSVSLPYTIPENEIEKNAGIYLYSKLDPGWTLAEDKAFREALRKFFKLNAAGAYRTGGRIVLPNRMTFMLVEPNDRTCQQKRNAWVKQQLEKAAK